jgi:hypothetical protein
MNDLMMKARVFLQLQRGFLFRYGWLRSWWEGKPLDAQGAPLPWLSYPAIDFLSQFDFSQASVFEWGSGYSTLWWAKRCRSLTSVESDPKWAAEVKALSPESVELITTPRDAEAEIGAFENHPRAQFDVIVIDNHCYFRWKCALAALPRLTEGGMIILDNSEQCLKACQVLREQRLVQIDFAGFAPSNGYAQTTSIFFRGCLKFRARGMTQPHSSPAQPNAPWKDC